MDENNKENWKFFWITLIIVIIIFMTGLFILNYYDKQKSSKLEKEIFTLRTMGYEDMHIKSIEWISPCSNYNDIIKEGITNFEQPFDFLIYFKPLPKIDIGNYVYKCEYDDKKNFEKFTLYNFGTINLNKNQLNIWLDIFSDHTLEICCSIEGDVLGKSKEISNKFCDTKRLERLCK